MIGSLLFSWRDAVEIGFFATLIYYISLWLKKDQQKKLLPYFYTYCMLIFIAHHAQLSTISHLFYTSSAFILLFFVLIHQHTLQKNFVTLHALIPTRSHKHDWLEVVTQSSLIALNNNKAFSCVIERHDLLTSLLETPQPLYADATKSLLDIVMQSPLYDHTRMLWINAHGKLLGINARWLYNHHEQISMPTSHDYDTWLQEALFFTSKTDALLFITTPATRTVTLVVQGKSKDKLAMHDARTIIKQYLAQAPHAHAASSRPTKENTHAHANTDTSHIQQRTP